MKLEFIPVKREVLEQVVEALAYAYINSTVIAALRAALEQPAVEPVAEVVWSKDTEYEYRFNMLVELTCKEGVPVKLYAGPFESGGLYWHDTEADKPMNTAPQPAQQSCPVCGSDCNERDELIKAEREIERLHAENEALRSSLERCKEVAAKTASCWNDDMKESEALLHQARATSIQACIDRLEQGVQPAAVQILRHHFAKDMGEE